MRQRRHGDPYFTLIIVGDDVARFWSKVDKTLGYGPDGECWLWTDRLNEDGYGHIKIGKRDIGAHRYAFFLEYGHYPEPIGRHTCDTPNCVRFNHIIEGTKQDNSDDKFERGRIRFLRGDDLPCSKLTEAKVRLIKVRICAGDMKAQIARDNGVSGCTIRDINCGRTWGHVII